MAAKAKKLFDLLDENKDGHLELAEFTKFVKAIVAEDTEDNIVKVAASILNITDTNKDGKVDIGEWNTMILSWDHPKKDDILDMFIAEAPAAKKNVSLSAFKTKKLMALFHKLDTKNNGTLDFDELGVLANALNVDIAVNLFKALDKNLDERISSGEWLRGMKPYGAIPDHEFGPKFDEYMRLIDEDLQKKAKGATVAAPPPPLPSQAEVRTQILKFLQRTDTQYRYILEPIRPNSFVVTFSKPTKHFPVPKYHIEAVFLVDQEGLKFYVEDEEQPRVPSKMDVQWTDKWLDVFICKKMMFAKLASTKAMLDDPWLNTRIEKQKWKDSEPEAEAAAASSV